MPSTQKHRNLAIGTPLGDDVLLLRSFSGVETLGWPFEYRLELCSEKADISFTDILGQNVTVRLELSGGRTRYINGVINRFGHAGQQGRNYHYQATLVPWLWLLTRASDCRIFQEMSAPDIIKKVFRDRGFSDFREMLSGSYRKWEYCVQYRETDFSFVSRLMEQEGIYYYFEHENGKHTLVLSDSINAHSSFPGYESVIFRPTDQGVHQQDLMHQWRAEEQLQPGAFELNDFDFKAPRKSLFAKSRQSAPHAFSDLPIYDYPGEYTEFSDGQHYSQMRLQELQAQHLIYSGQANARGLAAGYTFKLTEFPVAEMNREYLVTQTNYAVRGDAFEAEGGAGEGEFCSVRCTAIEVATPFRTPRATPKPIIQGPQTALVVGKAGEEIWTDSYGRVKVKFHWDRYAKADENSSCWIRVSQNWAGKKWGTFFLPRIGQEVIVEFLEGDPDRPIVTGCVYNGDAPTPYDLPKEATKSTIKTNTSKGGNGFNEIRFEDKKGKEQIFIHGQRDLDVRVRDDIRETNYGNRDMRVGWEKDGATGGNFNTLVRKDVNMHVKGGQFEEVEKQLNQTVKEDVVEDYQKNQSTFVKETLQLNAKEIIIEGATAINEKAGKISIQGAESVHIKGAQVAIEGSTGVSLKVGGNFVSLSPAGVAIKGTLVMINSGGAGLAAQSPKAAVAAEIQAPLAPTPADTGKTGEVTKTAATPISLVKRILKSQLAPPFVVSEPAEAPTPPTPPPTSAQPVKGCPKPQWKLKCQHGRQAGQIDGRMALEVVPARSKKIEIKIGGDWELFSASREFGAHDVLSVEMTNFQACGGCGCKPSVQVQLLDTKVIPAGGGTAEAGFQGRASVLWLAAVAPTIGAVKAGGASCLTEDVEVRVYPSDKYTLKGGTEKIAAKIQPVLDEMVEFLSNFSDDVPTLQIPRFTVSGEWGWEEEKATPRAYFKWQAKLSASIFKFTQTTPLATGEIQFKASLNKFFGPGALIVKYAADFKLYIKLTPKLELTLDGASTGSGPKDYRLTGGVDGKVPISFGLEVVPSPKMKVGGYKADAALATSFTASAKLAYDFGQGPGLAQVKVAWKGIEAVVKFEIKGSGWFSWAEAEFEKKWPLVKGGSFPSGDGLEWFPFNQSTPSTT